tara:strand:- start:1978 stop:3429 length:1452 start_codon:yes stop_codon:yes gene_type:complete
MSYIGVKPKTAYDSVRKDRFTSTTGTTVTLSYAVSSVNDILVWVNGVKQDYTNYSVSSTTLTLGGTLVSSDIVEVAYLGRTYGSVVPNDASVGTSALQDDAVTTAKINDGAVTSGKIASGVVPSLRPNAKPLIINGNCAVSQRGTSATDESSGGYYRVDRMYFAISSMGEGRLQQESLTSGNAFDNGFRNAWRVDCAVADASPAASDYMYLQYNLEGQDLQVFKKGTSNAEKFTLAFWVKSSKTGTGNIQLKDKDNSNRQCTQSYTISSANTWEHKVCVFGADTTGAFDDDNGKSLNINWWLDSGSNYDSGTANHGTWEAQDNTKVNAGGTLNIQDNTANDWAITGIQLEVGEYTSSTLPPFQHESYGDNLARCQRYYLNYVEGSNKMLGIAASYNSNEVVVMHNFPTTMRTAPTLEINTGSNYYSHGEDGNVESVTGSNVSIDRAMLNGTQLLFTSMSSNSGDGGIMYTNNSSSKISYTAEL